MALRPFTGGFDESVFIQVEQAALRLREVYGVAYPKISMAEMVRILLAMGLESFEGKHGLSDTEQSTPVKPEKKKKVVANKQSEKSHDLPEKPVISVQEAYADDNKVGCLACGKMLGALSNHIGTHGTNKTEYLEHFGLPADTLIVSKNSSKKMQKSKGKKE